MDQASSLPSFLQVYLRIQGLQNVLISKERDAKLENMVVTFLERLNSAKKHMR